MLQENFVLLAKYNQWINSRLYDCAATLSQDQLVKDQGAFFKSVQGTLNHIMVADILWLNRISYHPARFKALEYFRGVILPTSLDQTLFSDLNSLRGEREKIDELIIEFVEALDEDILNTKLDYKNTKGIAFQDKLSQLLSHIFNHQTHHRGQLTTLFNQMQVEVGATDLLVMMREGDKK